MSLLVEGDAVVLYGSVWFCMTGSQQQVLYKLEKGKNVGGNPLGEREPRHFRADGREAADGDRRG